MKSRFICKIQSFITISLVVAGILSKANETPLFASEPIISPENPIAILNPGDSRPRTALVLSGGGARGIAHVGILKALERSGIKIDYIVGTSVGAVVGGLYSAGYTADQLDSIMTTTDWDHLLALNEKLDRRDLFLDQKRINDRNLISFRFDNFKFVVPEAISIGTSLNSFMQSLVWNSLYHYENNFDDLKYCFRAVSTDLAKGHSFSHKSGSLVTALRASSTLPLRFSPVRLDSMVLVDGGIMANIPIKQSLEFNPDIIIVGNTISPLLNSQDLNTPWNIADQVISITMMYFSRPAFDIADFIITPEISGHQNVDFNDVDTLIKKGYEKALSEIGKIKERVESFRDSSVIDFLESINLVNYDEINFSGLFKKDSADILNENNINSFRNRKILAGLLDRFYKTGHYSSFSFFKTSNSGRNILEIRTNENPVIMSVKIHGSAIAERISLADSLTKHISNSLCTPECRKEIEARILRYYRNNGYSFARIMESRFESKHGELIIDIDEGLVNTIEIEGNDKTSSFLIMRELEFKIGSPLNSNHVIASWENLVNTGLFNDIEIIPKTRNGKTGVDLKIKLKERGTQTLSLGVRVDNERNTQAGLDLIQDNLFNIGARLFLRIAGGTRNQSFVTGIEVPRLLSTMLSFRMNAFYKNREVYEYQDKTGLSSSDFARIVSDEIAEQRYGLKASIGTQIEKLGLLSTEYRFERQRHYKIDSSDKPPLYNISTIKVGTLFDSEDNAFFPTKGSLIELSLESTFLQPKATIGFSRVKYYHRMNFSFGDHTIRPSLFFGYADKTLPPPEFFSLGGQDVFYGYREDEERGRQMLLTSLQYRVKLPFRLFFDTYFSLRYDMGAVWKVPENIRSSSFRHGIGGNLALDTPLGPGKIALGRSFYFLKDPAGVSWGELMVYFSIGIKI